MGRKKRLVLYFTGHYALRGRLWNAYSMELWNGAWEAWSGLASSSPNNAKELRSIR